MELLNNLPYGDPVNHILKAKSNEGEAKIQGTFRLAKNAEVGEGGEEPDGSVVLSACCTCRGAEVDPQYLHHVAHNCL